MEDFDDDVFDGAEAIDDALKAADNDDTGPTEEDFDLADDGDEGRTARNARADDEGSDLDFRAYEAAQQKRQQEARDVAASWASEVDKRQAALSEAREAWKKAERDYENDAIDLDKKAEIQQQLIDARYRLNEAETNRSAADRAVSEQAQQIAPAAQAWIAANPRFNTDRAFQDQALELSQRLTADGYDASHPRFYQELDRRLRSTPRMNGNGRTSGGPVNRVGGPVRRGGSATLTDFDKKMMGRFGLNPRDQRHVKQWMGNKAALARREGRGR